ncbi:MAG: helix-turn-helix transcriptional regulator, partial [Micromonosporaceae bacterium]
AASRYAGQVRDLMRASPDGPPSLSRIAAELMTTPRTLRRHLAREGTSFRALLTEVRDQLAVRWLSDGSLPVREIAERLGYADTSTFTHAFTRRHGQSPREYRSRLE